MRRRTITPLLSPRKQKPEYNVTLNTYILDGKTPVRCLDYELWERWIDYPDERCLVEKTEFYHDGTIVATKFLGFDVAPAASLGPLLFETTVKGGEIHGYRGLYKTWLAAEVGHNEACHLVRETLT